MANFEKFMGYENEPLQTGKRRIMTFYETIRNGDGYIQGEQE